MLIQSQPNISRNQGPKPAAGQPQPKPPAAPEAPADNVEISTPANQENGGPEQPKEHGFVYKAARFVVGSVGAVVGGTIGTAIGGVLHAGDTVIPEKVQKVANKVLRPGLAAVGAGVGIWAGLAGIPLLGPARLAMLGSVAGAVVGGGIVGATDALLASGKGGLQGGNKGRKKGFAFAAGAFDKIASKFQKNDPPPPQTPKQ